MSESCGCNTEADSDEPHSHSKTPNIKLRSSYTKYTREVKVPARPKSSSKSNTKRHEFAAETIMALFKDDQFKDLLRETVTSLVTSCIASIESKLSTSIEQNIVCIEQQQGILHDVQNQMGLTRTHLTDLQTSLGNAKTALKKYENELEDLKQYSHRNSIRILGLPEMPSENTDQLELAIDLVTKSLGINLSPANIDRSHRVGKPRSSSAPANAPPDVSTPSTRKMYDRGSSQARNLHQSANRPRPILVKLCSYRHKRD